MDPDSAWKKWGLEQHSLIRSIVAACEDSDGGTDIGTRRLEDWVGKSSDKINRGGGRRQESANRGLGGLYPALLAEVLRQEFSNLSLTLLPDSSITRGGCLIESSTSAVDATIEKRWSRAVGNLGMNVAWNPENADV